MSQVKRKQTNDLTQGILAKNELLSSYKYFRYHILQGSTDKSLVSLDDGTFFTIDCNFPTFRVRDRRRQDPFFYISKK